MSGSVWRKGQVTWSPEHPAGGLGFYPAASGEPLKGFKPRVTCPDVPFRKRELGAKWRIKGDKTRGIENC